MHISPLKARDEMSIVYQQLLRAIQWKLSNEAGEVLKYKHFKIYITQSLQNQMYIISVVKDHLYWETTSSSDRSVRALNPHCIMHGPHMCTNESDQTTDPYTDIMLISSCNLFYEERWYDFI